MTGDSQVGRLPARSTDEVPTGERRGESALNSAEYQGRHSYSRETGGAGSPDSRLDTGANAGVADRHDLLITPAPYPRAASEVASSRLEVTAASTAAGLPTEKTVVQSSGARLA